MHGGVYVVHVCTIWSKNQAQWLLNFSALPLIYNIIVYSNSVVIQICHCSSLHYLAFMIFCQNEAIPITLCLCLLQECTELCNIGQFVKPSCTPNMEVADTEFIFVYLVKLRADSEVSFLQMFCFNSEVINWLIIIASCCTFMISALILSLYRWLYSCGEHAV